MLASAKDINYIYICIKHFALRKNHSWPEGPVRQPWQQVVARARLRLSA